MARLDSEKCVLVVVDVQGKLAQLMHDKEILFKNICIFIESAKILGIPIIWCQQCPESLGATVPEIAELLGESKPINKTSFSCCGNEQFNTVLKSSVRPQVLLCGIETHVCIYQTAMDLHEQRYNVNIIADAVSSRTLDNKTFAFKRMDNEGIKIYTTEMALFEMLETAEHPRFKEIVKLVK